MRKKIFSCGVFAPDFCLLLIPNCLVCLLTAFCLPAVVPAARAASEAGIVIEITPGAFVERGGEKIPLELKTPVHSGDTLITDATGRLRVFMEDDTAISFGAGTSFTLESYNAEGSNPEFAGRMAHGLLRVLTGRITEANPKGFTVATPEGTVGIRGTIITLRSENGMSTVFVENTMRQVVVNGVDVPTEHKITIAPDMPPSVSPIEPADRRQIGRDLAAVGQPAVAAAAPEPGSAAPASAEIPTLSAAPPGLEETAIAGLPVNDMTTLTLPPPTASVTGTLTSGAYFAPTWNHSGTFGFQVDLRSGGISDGYARLFLEAAAYPSENYSYNLSGGTGQASAGGFQMHLSGTYTLGPGGSYIPPYAPNGTYPAAADIWGPENLLALPNGGSVSGQYNVAVGSGPQPDMGSISGSLAR